MKLFLRLRHRLATLFNFRIRQSDLDKELRFHVVERAAELERSGLATAEAEREARREFGVGDRFEEECRDAWGWRGWHDFRRDVALAARRMGQAKGFSIVVILTFALGVGLNTVMFSLFNSLWLNPGLFPQEDRVVRVFEHFDGGVDTRGQNPRGTSPLYYRERAEQSELAQAMALTMEFEQTLSNLEDGLAPEHLAVLGVTPSLFEVLGIAPLLGRGFTEAEAEVGNDQVAVLTHEYWSTRFQADPAVIGRIVHADGVARRIVGVMPAHFTVPANLHLTDGSLKPDAMMLVPFGPRNWWEFLNEPHQRHFPWAGCFARLKPGVTPEQFRAELNAINARNGPLHPEQWAFEQRYGHRTEVASMRHDLIRENRTMLGLLQGAMAFVLVVGGVNVTSLVLSRNSTRRQEFSLRLSLGASRGRLAAQLVTETWLLALLGGLAGVGLAWAGMQVLDAIGTFRFFVVTPRLGLEGPVLGYALLLASAVGVAVGVGSVLPVLRDDRLREALAEDSRTGTAGRQAKLVRATLLATQILFTAVLLVSGGLLLRSFTKILAIDPGFETERMLTGAVRLPQDRYDEEGTKRFVAEFEQRLHDLPGVEAVGMTNWPPLKLSGAWTWKLIRPGDDFLSRTPPVVIGDTVGRYYFEALGIPLLRGRVFHAEDFDERTAVAVIDRRVAETHFAEEDPIGQLIAVPWHRDPLTAETSLRWLRVIGVVEAIRGNDLLGYSPLGGMVYQTYAQEVPYWAGFVLRTRGDPAAMLPAIQDVLANLAPMAAVTRVETMTDTVKRRYGRQQIFVFIGLGLAVVALVICTLGVYGMLAHAVAAQEKEIAIRRVLGARDLIVLRQIVGFWLKAAGIGLVTGLVATAVLTGFMADVLYQTSAWDPVAFVGSTLGLAATVLAAAVLSARRALGRDLNEVLRR